MGEGSLSQDEIDALLQGADDSPYQDISPSSTTSTTTSTPLSPVDKEILSEIIGSSFNLAASTLSSIISKSCRISVGAIDVKKPADLVKEIGNNIAFLTAKFLGQALSGKFTLTLPADSASKLVSVMMGGMSQGMDTAQMKSFRECMEPMLGTVTAQIQQKLSVIVTNSSMDVNVARISNDVPLPEGSQLVKTNFNLDVEGIPTIRLSYIVPLSTAEDILSLSRKNPQHHSEQHPPQQSGGIHIPTGNVGMNINQQQPGQQMQIKNVGFPSLSTAGTPQGGGNLNLLMDVQMALTVELGRTKMYIKDILGLGEGSIIELDKLAGEPVDLLVNGKLIAKGEVVVIDENFGVRVTDIVSPTDRLKTEGK